MAKAETKSINPNLVKAINDLLTEVLDGEDENGKKYSLTDKAKILDRALALEKIKLKIDDETWGSGFNDEEEPVE